MKTTLAPGLRERTYLATAVMGETVVETFAFSAGKCFSIISTNAGQHEDVIFLPPCTASFSSCASCEATASAPSETSTASEKPSFFSALFSMPTVAVPK